MSKPIRVIPLIGDFDEELFSNFLEAFHEADSKRGDIVINIHSGGGSVDVGIALHDVIRTSHNKVITVGLGAVSSMAVLVLAAGDYRLVTEGTTLLIHDGTVNLKNSLLKAKDHLQEQIRLHNWYADRLAERSRLSAAEWRAKMEASEWFLDANGAVGTGLVDEIIPYRTIKVRGKR